MRLNDAGVGCLLAVSLAGCARPKAVEKPFLPLARRLVAAVNVGDQAAIQNAFTPEMRRYLPPNEAQKYFGAMKHQRGEIRTVSEIQVDDGIGYFRLLGERGAWDLQLMRDDSGLISNLQVLPAGPAIDLPPHNTVPLRLPFKGEWEVLWGGPTKKQNYYLPLPSQRRAIDFFIRDANHSSHQGGGRSNENYFAYGKDVLAAAPGTIVASVDGVPDNAPGKVNPQQPFGNYLIVQQAPHEFAVYAHLQPASLQVRKGGRIEAGQVLAKCGNSGRSDYPHLHFHLQNTPDLKDGAGIPLQFQTAQVVRNGESTLMKDYTPLRDDLVSAP